MKRNIIRVPESKKIKKYKHIQESFFDSNDDMLSSEIEKNNDTLDVVDDETLKTMYQDDIEKINNLCFFYKITNYTFNFDIKAGVSITIKGDLDASNKKWRNVPIPIKEVTGNVDLRNNRLTSFKSVPRKIGGTLKIEKNHITDFQYAPVCKKMVAERQFGVKPKYPLT